MHGRKAESALRLASVDLALVAGVARCGMSVLDDFARMRLHRNRASEFELLAEVEPLPEARLRYRIIAQIIGS
jgi:hypothetical protein